MSSDGTGRGWQVVEVTGIGIGELWFETVADGLRQDTAESRAARQDNHIAIPEPAEMPEDWGEQWINDELEVDDYAF